MRLRARPMALQAGPRMGDGGLIGIIETGPVGCFAAGPMRTGQHMGRLRIEMQVQIAG